MLAALTTILREQKLLDPGDEPGYNITLVKEDILNIAAFPRSGGFFHIRLKARGMMPQEHDSIASARRSFPGYAPELLGRFVNGDWEVIIVRGVRHRRVQAGSIAQNKCGLVPKIVGFLEASSTGARLVAPVEPHHAFLRQVQERMIDPLCLAIVSEWNGTARLDALPHIRQHGDFVLNNIGLTDTGLVVFDWEDFGRITFPGFDLCTLLASDTGFNADRLRSSDTYAELLEKSCPLIGLTPRLFRQLIPLYLVIFLDIKREYGEGIRSVTKELIHDIQGAS